MTIFWVTSFLTLVIFFLDELDAPGRLIGRSGLDFGVCLHEVSRGERFSVAIAFEAVLSTKAAPVRQCEGQNIAW